MAGSLLCAVADSIGLLIAGRIVQAVGAALGPLAVGIVRDSMPPEQLTRGLGVLVGAAGAGAAVGYVCSGVLVEHVSLDAIFWFLLALAILLMAAAVVLVPPAPAPAHGRVPVDLAGAGLIASGLAALLLAVSKGNEWGWTSGRVLGLFAAAVALLTALVIVERSVRHPLIDPLLFSGPPFEDAMVCALAVGTPSPSSRSRCRSSRRCPKRRAPASASRPRASGCCSAVALASIASAWAAGRYVDHVGPRALMAAGSAAAIAGYVSLVVAHGSAAAIAAATGVLGLAVVLTVTGVLSLVARAAPLDKTSVATAVNAVTRTTGATLGAAAAAAILTGALTVRGFPAESGFTGCFVMGAIASACLIIGAGARGASWLEPRQASVARPPARSAVARPVHLAAPTEADRHRRLRRPSCATRRGPRRLLRA